VLVFFTDLTIRLSSLARGTVGLGGLSNNDVRVLIRVRDLAGPTPSEIAQSIGIPRSAVSRSLRSLTAQGVVQRHTKPTDRRSHSLTISREGNRRFTALWEAMTNHLAEVADEARYLAELLDPQPYARTQSNPAKAASEVIDQLAASGAVYVRPAQATAKRFGIGSSSSDRFALTLITFARVRRPSHLARRLELTASGTSAVIDRLVSAGLIARVGASEGDGRAVRLFATPLGQRAAKELLEPVEAHAGFIAAALADVAALPRRPDVLAAPLTSRSVGPLAWPTLGEGGVHQG
jgi:DNA-binding MarR family transcriptional regulator